MTETKPVTNQEITKTLIENGIITHKDSIKCGQWINLKPLRGSDFLRPIQKFCEREECRSCRETKNNKIRESHFIQNKTHQERGGNILLMTLTIPHKKSDSFGYLYPRFKKSLQEMKRGKTWRRIKKETGYEYHYDTIEFHETDQGYHIQNHMTFGCNKTDLDLKKIKSDLVNTWSLYTSKNGLEGVSEKGQDVFKTHLSNHSNETDTKTIEGLSEIYGTNEYWEKVYHRLKNEDNYQNPFKTTEEIKKELIMRNSVTSKSKRGKIHRNHNPNRLNHLQTKRTILVEVVTDPKTGRIIDRKGISIDALERSTLWEEDLPFPRETCKRLAKLMRNQFKDGWYCELRISKKGIPSFKWVPDKHKIYSYEYRSSD